MRRVIAVLTCLVLVGCGNQVRFESTPPGATVSLNGEEIGTTPFSIHLASARWYGGNHELRFELPGFRPVVGPPDWTYDPRHLWWLSGILIPITQVMHVHPRAHRRLRDVYHVVFDEDLGDGGEDRRVLYGYDEREITEEVSQ